MNEHRTSDVAGSRHGIVQPCRRIAAPSRHRGFTLMEVLVVISIIGLLAVVLVTSMYGAAETARRMRSQQTVTKIHNLLMPRWESYQTRKLPTLYKTTVIQANQVNAGVKTRPTMAIIKLWALRELIRMEIPDRYRDLTFRPAFLTVSNGGNSEMPWYPDLSRLYQKEIQEWSGTPLSSTVQQTNEPAECLYLTVTVGSQDRQAMFNSFTADEMGDTDRDGMPEFVDGWSRPIQFLRWAPGFVSDQQPVFSISSKDPSVNQYAKGLPPDPQNPDNFFSHFPVMVQIANSTTGNTSPYAFVNYHDAFDPLEVDPRLNQNPMPNPERGFNLIPLIMSAGADGVVGTNPTDDPNASDGFGLYWGLAQTLQPNASSPMGSDDDPYMTYAPQGSKQTVQRGAPNGPASYDNVHNHLLGTRK
jgi:prepilin-type N-terminal cleavage/methylation domain-containing protein